VGPVSFQQSVSSTLDLLEAANKAIEKAQVALSNNQGMSNAEVMVSLATARGAVQQVAQRQQQVTEQFAQLAALGTKIENEKATLQRDKSDLEARERVYSISLVAAIGGFLIAAFGNFYRIPMDRLDKQLKRLEIREKEIALRKIEGEKEKPAE
jgi:hypothetical protein